MQACNAVARDLLDLIDSSDFGRDEVTAAVRNIGYAMHPLPLLLDANEAFSSRFFRFNFSMAMRHVQVCPLALRVMLTPAPCLISTQLSINAGTNMHVDVL